MPTIIKSKARFDIPVRTGVPRPKFAISTFTAQYGWYIPVRQVADTRTARYWAVPPKIDHRRSIEGEIDVNGRLSEKKGRRRRRERKKKKKIKEEKRNTYLPCAVAARAPSPPAGRGSFSSRTRRKIEG
ncbi:hypothetical protein B296_00037133, partial [Ensete ventricosum]